jgi:Sec7-like guanine-nucleotide exchange factor
MYELLIDKNEVNFIKYQKDINEILIQYYKTIDRKVIYNILQNDDNTSRMMDLFKNSMMLQKK